MKKIYTIPEVLTININRDLGKEIQDYVTHHLKNNHTIPTLAVGVGAEELDVAIALHELTRVWKAPRIYLDSTAYDKYRLAVRKFDAEHELKQYTDKDTFYSWLLR